MSNALTGDDVLAVRDGAGHAPDDVAWVFHPDRDAWEQENMSSWAQAGPWIEAGFVPDEADEWQTTARMDAETAAVWRDLTGSPHIALDWLAAGHTPDTAAPWIESGLSPVEAATWLHSDLTVEDAAAWAPVSTFYLYVLARRDEGITPEEDLAAWEATSIPPDEWKDWTSSSANTAAVAEAWHTNGFELGGQMIWRDYEFTDPAEAAAWRDQGIEAIDAKDWRDSGYTPTEYGPGLDPSEKTT